MANDSGCVNTSVMTNVNNANKYREIFVLLMQCVIMCLILMCINTRPILTKIQPMYSVSMTQWYNKYREASTMDNTVIQCPILLMILFVMQYK